jgi:holo-[acyl-carrier protein] synthase
MKIATGVDLVDIARFHETIERHGDRFLRRIFTPHELEEMGANITSLAGRFAAKEAVAKALGTGIGAVTWHDVEVLRGPQRQPLLHLHGEALRLAGEMCLQNWAISLSHTHTHAIATVVATGNNTFEDR